MAPVPHTICWHYCSTDHLVTRLDNPPSGSFEPELVPIDWFTEEICYTRNTPFPCFSSSLWLSLGISVHLHKTELSHEVSLKLIFWNQSFHIATDPLGWNALVIHPFSQPAIYSFNKRLARNSRAKLTISRLAQDNSSLLLLFWYHYYHFNFISAPVWTINYIVIISQPKCLRASLKAQWVRTYV